MRLIHLHFYLGNPRCYYDVSNNIYLGLPTLGHGARKLCSLLGSHQIPERGLLEYVWLALALIPSFVCFQISLVSLSFLFAMALLEGPHGHVLLLIDKRTDSGSTHIMHSGLRSLNPYPHLSIDTKIPFWESSLIHGRVVVHFLSRFAVAHVWIL